MYRAPTVIGKMEKKKRQDKVKIKKINNISAKG